MKYAFLQSKIKKNIWNIVSYESLTDEKAFQNIVIRTNFHDGKILQRNPIVLPKDDYRGKMQDGTLGHLVTSVETPKTLTYYVESWHCQIYNDLDTLIKTHFIDML